jgi:hypothetical protein
VIRLIAILAATIMLVSCVGEGPGISGDLRNVGGVTVTFKVAPARVKVGQAVRFTFRLVNNVGREELLTFPNGQRYDFWVTSGTREAWRWSEGRVFVQAIMHETIASQSGLTFAESWTPESAGSYIAHGRLTASGYERPLTGRVVVQ